MLNARRKDGKPAGKDGKVKIRAKNMCVLHASILSRKESLRTPLEIKIHLSKVLQNR